ncbi:hypothetical protein NDU88_003569 [Pleurodeles waltl]|uniref:Uncharacterized protein n=1 Tax=Pleurodeles waltl TaxID=8319 RepID=A0AAV7LJ92_PLEWA|nr:hypothetical protein NDU88_003569 [Pleurodeles waltl]
MGKGRARPWPELRPGAAHTHPVKRERKVKFIRAWTRPQPPQARSGTSREAGAQGSVYPGLDPPPAATSKIRRVPRSGSTRFSLSGLGPAPSRHKQDPARPAKRDRKVQFIGAWTRPQPPQAGTGASPEAGAQGSVYRGLDQPPQARSGASLEAGAQSSIYRGLDPPPADTSKIRQILCHYPQLQYSDT